MKILLCVSFIYNVHIILLIILIVHNKCIEAIFNKIVQFSLNVSWKEIAYKIIINEHRLLMFHGIVEINNLCNSFFEVNEYSTDGRKSEFKVNVMRKTYQMSDLPTLGNKIC